MADRRRLRLRLDLSTAVPAAARQTRRPSRGGQLGRTNRAPRPATLRQLYPTTNAPANYAPPPIPAANSDSQPRSPWAIHATNRLGYPGCATTHWSNAYGDVEKRQYYQKIIAMSSIYRLVQNAACLACICYNLTHHSCLSNKSHAKAEPKAKAKVAFMVKK